MTPRRGTAPAHKHRWQPFVGAEGTHEWCPDCFRVRAKPKRHIPITNEIASFLHCVLCLVELPPDQSPREFGQMEVGWTPLGIQVWCRRHEANVLHIDFDGQQHRANTHRLLRPGEEVNNLTEPA